MSMGQEYIVETFSVLSSLDFSTSCDENISSSDLHELSEKLSDLSLSYENFIHNESFTALANIDETIGYFLEEDDGAIELSMKIAEAEFITNTTADYLYSIDVFSHAPEASCIDEFKDAVLELVTDIVKCLKRLTMLRSQDFYYSIISYASELPSACPMTCLSTADKNLSKSISVTLGSCMNILSGSK
jgi:hypothetical protein